MLNAGVAWNDIDATQWSNLWRFIHSPERRPVRAIAVLEGGHPLALVHGTFGQLPLSAWPIDEPSLAAVAERLRRDLEVDQVILVESSALTDLWDRQQRSLDPEVDYDDYVLAIRSLTDSLLEERAICAPVTSALRAFPPIPYEQVRNFVAGAVARNGAFLLAVFDGDTLWWSLAGLIADGSIVRLTSSQGLLPATAPLTRVSWRDANTSLVEACEHTLGPVHLALAFQLRAFETALESRDLVRTLDRLSTTDDVIFWRNAK